MTKNASSQSEWNGRLSRIAVRKDPADKDDGKLRKFSARLRKHSLGQRISSLGAGHDCRKQRCKIWVRITHAHELVECVQFPCCLQFAIERQLFRDIFTIACFDPLIDPSQESAHSRAPDPMGRAFIGNGKTPTSRPRRSSLLIATVSDRTRPSNDDDSRARAKSGFQRNLHVAHHIDLSGNHFSNNLAHIRCNFLTPSTRHANADPFDLGWIDLRRTASLAYSLMQ